MINLDFLKIRKKYHFIDHTDEIIITKRILKILHKKVKNNIYELTIADIIRSLRWSNGVFKKDNANTKRRSKVSTEAKIYAIYSSLEILQYLTILESTEIVNFQLDNKFKIINLKDETEFDKRLNQSDLLPIEGAKQILTKEMKKDYHNLYNINYQDILNKHMLSSDTYINIVNEIIPLLEAIWQTQYYKMRGNKITLTKFPTFIDENSSTNYYCLFDDHSMMYDIDVLDEDFAEDRTVVIYGFSRTKLCDRKKKDIEMRYDNTRKWTDKQTDLGHYCAHSVGGNIWTNIFPQKREINQGKSDKGKIYRQMERFIAKNDGIFFFSRPIYFDFSFRPYIIEFGYMTKDFKWVVEYFENV